MHIPKWLIATAGLLFVVLIATVAFFIGRETSQPPEAPESKAAVAEAAGSAMTSSIAPSTSGTAATEAPPSTESAAISTTSAPAAAVDIPQASPEARARVAAYFKQMEAIQSGGSGDQEAFANTILQGALSGDFSGMDDLVRTAGDAERRAAALQPPAECAEYHRMAVTMLQESMTMITALRDGLKRNDTNALASIGAAAQNMKSRADTLAAAERALRTRFGL